MCVNLLQPSPVNGFLSLRHKTTGNETLAADDAEVFDLIRKEKHRQVNGLELIASEVNSAK